MRADERGTIAFVRPRAHIYKLLLSGGIPEEVIVDGPYVYTNGNVQAAMNDTTVKPWTKLDTRRLTARQRRSNGDELAHVRAPAYLIDGVAHLRRVGVGSGGVVHVQGMVDPARLAAHVPAVDPREHPRDRRARLRAEPLPRRFLARSEGARPARARQLPAQARAAASS